MLTVALSFPSESHATVYYSDAYFDVTVGEQTVTFERNKSAIPTECVNSQWTITGYYDWDFDGTWVANWVHANDISPFPLDYDKQFILQPLGVSESVVVVPLDPRYQVYFFEASVGNVTNSYKTTGYVVNSRAEVVLANDEPTPVRLQEIGLSSQASTLAPDVLPVSMDGSDSEVGTMPVEVVNVSGDYAATVLGVGGLLCFAVFLLAGYRLSRGF